MALFDRNDKSAKHINLLIGIVMSELTKTLLNIRSLRAFSRELTLEQLEEALDKLTTVVTERLEAEEAERAAQAEQEAKLAEIADKIAQDGIDVQALISALSGETKSKAKSKRAPRPPKYKLTVPFLFAYISLTLPSPTYPRLDTHPTASPP